ncbi:MAG TPA: hypothetical protein VHW01_00830 [Polyangiaceae bacterium]|nr:hypothetical protein [Polyangiaceae bacterium]
MTNRAQNSGAFVASSRAGAALVVVCAALVACSVDSRQLELAVDAGGQAGSPPSVGGSSSNGGNAASSAGQSGSGTSLNDGGAGADAASAGAGSGGQAPTLVDGCADLDADKVADCQETLAQNADFNSDVAGWVAEAGTTLSWDAQNAWGDVPSGSALVSASGVVDADANGAALHGATQCLPVANAELVTVYANALVDSGQDSQGLAEVDVSFYDAAACAGMPNSSFSTPQPLGQSVGSWLSLQAGSVTGKATQSMLLTLAISLPFRASTFHARFDNILVKASPSP